MENTSGNKLPKCPFCLKRKATGLVCTDCNRSSLQHLKTSDTHDDAINASAMSIIHNIFAYSQRVRTSTTIPPNPMESYLSSESVPTVSVESVKILAMQLLKLDIINDRQKHKSISRSIESIQNKIEQRQKEIERTSRDITALRDRLSESKKQMLDTYNQHSEQIAANTLEIRNEKDSQIQKQCMNIQLQNFKVFKEIALSRKVTKSFSFRQKSRSVVCLFGSPIIPLSSFLEHNSRLTMINEFLENLIKFQLRLVEVIRLGDWQVQLPYLEELQYYLPDQSFYKLVQEKEDFMMNGIDSAEKPSTEEKQEVQSPENKPLDLQELQDTEKIIKLGDAIKLPLSSKTINDQLRRVSLSGQKQSLPSIVEVEQKRETSKVLSNFKRTFSGKKMVIVPHKILTKPFTKLSTKEYLKFLLIIVKILVNFQVYLFVTSEYLPTTLKPKSSSSFLNGMDSNGSRNGKRQDPSEIIYDFERLLKKIESTDQYLILKLHLLDEDEGKVTPDNASSSGLEKSESSLVKSLSSFLKEPPKKATDMGMQKVDLKIVMQNVYKIIANGPTKESTKSKKSANGKSEEFDQALSMMAQSKVHLDDWDVVSKMY